jgi:DNA-directed RNA polymerase
MDYIVDQREKGNHHPFGENPFKAATFLAKVIWDSIGEVVHAATDAMSWLQRASRVASSEGLPIRWDTPCNFPVLQAYPETRPYRIETKLLGSAFRPLLFSATGRLDKNRQSNGVSPNFVHSVDAAHMMVTKAFVEMYSQVDVLENFRNDLLDVLPAHRHSDIEPIPPKGDLDINVVEDSPFFFA